MGVIIVEWQLRSQFSASANTVIDQRWMLDSGAQQTITGHFEDFYSYEPVDPTYAYAYRSVSSHRDVTKGKGLMIVEARTLLRSTPTT
jgi:hypothetical protein